MVRRSLTTQKLFEDGMERKQAWDVVKVGLLSFSFPCLPFLLNASHLNN